MTRLKPGFGRLASMQELVEILNDRVPRLGAERVELHAALGRVLSEDLLSEIDVPHFVKAAMDGFAVVASDTFGASDDSPVTLKVLESVMPGDVPADIVSSGRCVEIGTGAPLPHGADAVVMVENTDPLGKEAGIRRPVAPGENVIKAGSDISVGTAVIAGGTRLEPRHLGVIAACGSDSVQVVRRPRVALFSTGPELATAGSDLQAGQIYDINTHTLKAALTADGAAVEDLGIVPDEMEPLIAALRHGLQEADLVLLSGGSSLGGGDLVEAAFRELGKVLVHGVAVKPGKPVVVAAAPGEVEKLMIGLPGYPMSALSDYYLFIQPFIWKALGADMPSARFVQARLSRKHASTVGRYEFVLVVLEGDAAVPLSKGSSAISAMAMADGFIEIDENTEVVDAGAEVRVRLL